MRRVVATFPFPEPHLHRDKRRAFIEARYDEKAFGVPEWGDDLLRFGQEVWDKLAEYCRKHENDFS